MDTDPHFNNLIFFNGHDIYLLAFRFHKWDHKLGDTWYFVSRSHG